MCMHVQRIDLGMRKGVTRFLLTALHYLCSSLAVQENEEQLRASIERLKLEAATAREQAQETLMLAKGVQHTSDRLENVQKHALADMEKLQEKCTLLESVASRVGRFDRDGFWGAGVHSWRALPAG